jgi:plastocyanin
MRQLKICALCALIALLLAGCVQSGPNSNTTPTAVAIPTLGTPTDTNPDGFWYDQPSIKITVGTTVTWVNESSALHTVTSGQPGAPDGKFDSGTTTLLQPDDQGAASTYQFTFKTPGSYPYYCALHPAMIGLVQVVA